LQEVQFEASNEQVKQLLLHVWQIRLV